jgi:hypothetical protein
VAQSPSGLRRFFGIFLDPRAYTSLFYMLLTLATGIIYFTFVVTGLSLSAGLAILIVGVPFFLAFIGMARVISLGEGRLIEAITGERMPRRPGCRGADPSDACRTRHYASARATRQGPAGRAGSLSAAPDLAARLRPDAGSYCLAGARTGTWTPQSVDFAGCVVSTLWL